MKDIIKNIEQNSKGLTSEFKRLFHGRGGLYPKYNFLTIDSIDTILSVAFYFECEQIVEDEILSTLREFIQTSRHNIIILQKRYIKGSAPIVIEGKLNDENYAIENGIKFILNLKSNQNSGYFPDMKLGREFIKSISKD